jgi:hypothetical protein
MKPARTNCRTQNGVVTLLNAVLDSISAISGSVAAHGVTQKPVPQIKHGALHILP